MLVVKEYYGGKLRKNHRWSKEVRYQGERRKDYHLPIYSNIQSPLTKKCLSPAHQTRMVG